MPDHASTGHQVAFVRGVDEDFCGMYARSGTEPDNPGAILLDAFQWLFGQDLHAGLLEHGVGDAGGDVRFVGPHGVVLRRDIVRQFHAAGGVVGGDAQVPFLEEAEEGRADRLVGVAEAQAARVDAANMGRWFDEHHFRAFASGGDGGAEASGRGAVDDHISLRGPGGTGEQ